MTKYEPNVPYSEELNYFDRGLPPFDDIVQSKENLLYLYDLALTLQKLESFFRKRGESKEILIAALKATCEFYKADFCGALNVDLDSELPCELPGKSTLKSF